MPLINFHAARVRDPNDFIKDTYVTIVLKGVEGIELVNAKLKKDGKGGPLTAQSYRFDKDKFTEKQAKDWLKKHKTKTVLFEPAKEEVKEVIMSTPNFDTVWEKVKKKKCLIVPVPPASMSSRGMTEQKVVATTNGAGDYGYLFKGSYEELSRNIRDALIKSKEYGDWPSILATFPKKVFIKTYLNRGKLGIQTPDSAERKFFEIEYTLENDEVKIGDVTELEKKTQLFIKEWAEEIGRELFPLDEAKLFEAKWTVKFMNDLPDSSFAVISAGGEKDEEDKTTPRSLRRLPYKDEKGNIDKPHLRNALARLDQTDLTAEEKKKAKSKLDKAAKQAEVGD